MRNIAKSWRVLIALCLIAGLYACGGGGSGDSSSNAADLNVRLSDSNVDSGERVTVTVEISQVNDSGITLKIRYPIGLSYIRNSAFLVINDLPDEVRSSKNPSDATYEYLIFNFSANTMGLDRRGDLVFALSADSGVDNGAVEADADVGSDSSFNISEPQFSAQDSAGIEVTDE